MSLRGEMLTKFDGQLSDLLRFSGGGMDFSAYHHVLSVLNKEFKRRTKPMEIIAGENACYTLLAFISIKMEMYWRSNPVGKVHYNLPSLRNLIEGNFTQSP